MARAGVLILALLAGGCLVAKKDVDKLRVDLTDAAATETVAAPDAGGAGGVDTATGDGQPGETAPAPDQSATPDAQDSQTAVAGDLPGVDTARGCANACDDADPCSVDTCTAKGVCEHTAAADGAPCAGGSCKAGKCVTTAACGPGTQAVTIDMDGQSAVACAALAPVWGNQPLNPEALQMGSAGTAADKLSKLVWQTASAAQPLAWGAAIAHCDGLSLGGRSDWRLPTVVELSSLLHRAKASGPPAWDAAAFSGSTTEAPYWSSTPVAAAGDTAWVVDAKAGASNASQSKSSPLNVKCVAGSLTSPGAQFQASATEVFDTYTKLTWQRTAGSTTYTWSDAGAACSGLGTGWRLPNVVELQSIVDFQKSQPAADVTAFPACPAAGFWTATAYPGAAGFAWTVQFATGQVATASSAQKRQIRCVK